jgi:Mn2+/Fe2+ NRAMP family transporter
MRSPPRTLGQTLRQLGPGMIVAAAVVGSGELIATTKVGAEAGFSLLWIILIGCTIKVFAQVEFGRYTVTWNRTGLQALDSVPGPRWRVNWLLWYWVLVMALSLSQQGGIVGAVGQTLSITRPLTTHGAQFNEVQDSLVRTKVQLALAETQNVKRSELDSLRADVGVLSSQLDGFKEPLDAYLWAGVIAVVTSVILYFGRYALIQAVATGLVISFTLITLFTLIMMQTKPEWAIHGHDLMAGLSFRLPPFVEDLSANPIATALATFGIIGIGAAELIIYPYWCLEKGYARFTGPRDGSPQWLERARGWMRVLQIDAWTSMVVYTIATAAFFLLGAAVLSRSGLNPEKADLIRTLAEMYAPVFGAWTPRIFLLGSFAVLYSTFFVVAASYGRLITDALVLFKLIDGNESTRLESTRLISVLWPLIAVLTYIFIRAPVAMILASGLCQSVMLPMLGFAALYFRYKQSDPGLRPGKLWDLMLWLSFTGLLIIGIWALVSTIGPIIN